MQYFISFLEGIITFISPCLLPMLPIYISYFAGGGEKGKHTLKNSLGFVLGFTALFVAMGALAGAIGGFLARYRTWINVITGLIVVVFGLNYLGVLSINIFKGAGTKKVSENMGFASSFVFGVVFSVGWTPCVGAFLGSALMLASQQGSALTGVVMLLAYSLGLGIPFVLCALFLEKLKGTLGFVKRNYRVINLVCGAFLIVVGLLMMTGIMEELLKILSSGMNV